MFKEKVDTYVFAHNVNKTFHVGKQEIHVLKNISFTIKPGRFVIIFGPSGSGKSTLLHVLLGLEKPTDGSVELVENNLYEGTSEDDRALLRKKFIGMVYQQPNWIKSLSVLENVAFPLLLLGVDKNEAIPTALSYLTKVNMASWANYHPTELSGGQQQRVALARALINQPELIIADEPTGNLDYQSGQEIMQLLTQLNKEEHKTIIMVTHDLEYMSYANQVIRMLDGAVINNYLDKDIPKLLTDIKLKKGLQENT